MFWILVAGVVSLSIGFVMGARFRQYRPIKSPVMLMSGYKKEADGSYVCRFEEAVDWVTRDKFFTVSGAHKAFRS